MNATGGIASAITTGVFETTAYFASGGFLTTNRIASLDDPAHPHSIFLIETVLMVKASSERLKNSEVRRRQNRNHIEYSLANQGA